MRDKKWLIVFVLIILTITIASILNINHTKDTISTISNSIEVDDGDLSIDWSRFPTTNIELDESIELTKSGTYHLTGSLYDGSISIKGKQDTEVKLVLDNVTIINPTGPAILCYSANNLVIELVGENTITDGNTYSSDYDENTKSTIYSKADLTFEGEGTLNLTGYYSDGIATNDDLKFKSGTYTISAKDDAMRGKDSVYIKDGTFTINATADAIKSTNETDYNKGFVLIEDGNFNITAGAKGLKATKSILINNGNYVIITTDDAIHSDGYLGISDGIINISSGDDGIHANKKLEIKNGNIHVIKSYEGLEAQVVAISGGEISINAFDDGINAGGGNDQSSLNKPTPGTFDEDANCIVSINGGNIYINTAGDGIDSNGWLYFNGGKTIIDGPTTDNNGALDSGLGTITNGGEVIAIGSSGMATNLGESSAVNNISVYLGQTYPSNTSIEVRDAAGNTLISHLSAKTFNHIAIASKDFTLGTTYHLFLNNEEYKSFTISNVTTTIGNDFRPPRK